MRYEKAATCSHSSGCKRPRVATFTKWPHVAAGDSEEECDKKEDRDWKEERDY